MCVKMACKIIALKREAVLVLVRRNIKKESHFKAPFETIKSIYRWLVDNGREKNNMHWKYVSIQESNSYESSSC